MPTYERINAAVSITLIGLALYFVLDFPAEVSRFILFGSPLELESSRQWLMVILLGGMTMAGADAVVRAHPHLPTRRLSYMAPFWMLPGLLIVLATQTLGLSPTPVVWAIGLSIVGILLWLTLYIEYQQVFSQSRLNFRVRLWRQFIGYVIALTFFIVIYQTRSRSAVSASAILLISGMVALALLQQQPAHVWKSWLFALIIALGMGQITWALNYWRTGALNTGLLLFLLFYVLVGLAQQQLLGTLSRRTLWEFGVITSIGIIIIYIV